MPANKKYLTTSRWQRFAKISAGIVGGYILSVTFHLALAVWINPVNVMITMTFSGFILWTVLMVCAFLAKNGWNAWLLYGILSVLFFMVIYLGKSHL